MTNFKEKAEVALKEAFMKKQLKLEDFMFLSTLVEMSESEEELKTVFQIYSTDFDCLSNLITK